MSFFENEKQRTHLKAMSCGDSVFENIRKAAKDML
jgi:hypothetical protein